MIGKKVMERRLELGLTQQELANLMGYKSKSTINRIESNEHDVNQKNLEKLSKALKCPPTYFLDDIQIDHETYESDAVMEYAKKLSKLSPNNLDNVLKYIDFLSKN